MKSQIFLLLGALLLVQIVHSAPAESESSTTPVTSTTTSTTTTPSSTDTSSTTTAAPKTDANETTQPSVAVSSSHDQHQVNSSFTCFDRSIGYYADIERNCQVYHFCILGDYNGEAVYQRISYLCLNDTLFDQQILDCVPEAKMSAKCAESAKYFWESNKTLRESVQGNGKSTQDKSANSTESH